MNTYLVLAQEWQVENDLEWLSVGSEHDEVGKTTVKGLGSLIGSFLQLYHLTKTMLESSKGGCRHQ